MDRLAPAADDFGGFPRLVGGKLRAVVAAPAVHQVVDLVDDQDDVGEILVGGEAGERDVGVEDVVVVADRDLDAAGKLQADLEGADLGLLGGAEDVVGLDGRPGLIDAAEDAGGGELEAVVLGEAAVLLVAEDLVVGAHLRLGAQAQGAEGGVLVEQVEDGGGHLLLGVLGGEDEQPLVVGQGVLQRREEGGDGLADAGGGLQEQVLAVGDSGLDGGEDQFLARADLAVGESEALGRGVPLGGLAALGLPGVDVAVDAPPDGDLQRPEVGLQGLALGLVAADGDQHQLGADGFLLGLGEHPGVEQGLALVGLAHGRRQVAAAADRLDLLDHQRAVRLFPQAVGPALDGDLPAAVLKDMGDDHLAPVGRVVRQRLLLIAPVDGLAEPEALVAAAAGEAEAAQKGRVEQVGDGEVERAVFGVETSGHPGEVYGVFSPCRRPGRKRGRRRWRE